jgi:hypothetical protein
MFSLLYGSHRVNSVYVRGNYSMTLHDLLAAKGGDTPPESDVLPRDLDVTMRKFLTPAIAVLAMMHRDQIAHGCLTTRAICVNECAHADVRVGHLGGFVPKPDCYGYYVRESLVDKCNPPLTRDIYSIGVIVYRILEAWGYSLRGVDDLLARATTPTDKWVLFAARCLAPDAARRPKIEELAAEIPAEQPMPTFPIPVYQLPKPDWQGKPRRKRKDNPLIKLIRSIDPQLEAVVTESFCW